MSLSDSKLVSGASNVSDIVTVGAESRVSGDSQNVLPLDQLNRLVGGKRNKSRKNRKSRKGGKKNVGGKRKSAKKSRSRK